MGAKFRGHVRRNEKGPIYWTACTVTECDPGRGIRLPRAVTAVGASHCTAQHGTGHVALSLNPTSGGGTEVTESFELRDISAMRLYWRALGWVRDRG